MPLPSLYRLLKIGSTTSSILSDYFYTHLMTVLVSGSYYLDVIVSDSPCPSGVLPFYFDFLGVNSSSSIYNYQNNYSITSDIHLSTQYQDSELIQLVSLVKLDLIIIITF